MEDKAVNTVKKYSAKSYGFDPLPAMLHEVAMYIIFFMQTMQSVAAMNSAIYGPKWSHTLPSRNY